MSDPPWKDALRRAKAPTPTPARAAPAPSVGPPAGADPAALSPNLARLMAERQALESQMARLTGHGALGDPRYAVTPLNQRRAELDRWGAARDAARVAAGPRPDPHPPALPPALRGTAADALRTTPGEGLRATPGEQVRPTPGGLTPDLRRFSPTEVFERPAPSSRQAPWERPPASPREAPWDRPAVSPRDAPWERPAASPRETPWERPAAAPREAPWERLAARREAEPLAEPSRRLSSLADAGRGLRDAGRALRDPAERPRAATATDPLDRRLAKARDMVSRGRKAYAAAERALDSARDAIPSDWVERARERIPGLGRADPYVRETARKLSSHVGEIADFAEKADRLREMASDVRELKEADEARDDARRDRALERLKAKRSEESEGDA
ncbi:hypothetical protein CFHF_05770 [Caulobacter flavus]|uniref:Uncharacterized protein n=1 Tax=Caulobacter flavus TaxID=1679497 RepID=A0A2N5CWY4_9CAUL|nr:hypothetical protein [Caulobacter flavus]AYV47423.1 hypothetical protein C1707_14775 [Caulobacter flavus]PLR18266.1 hypothetical protein CFHF_05770 [Caulobacter flavus]